MGNASNQVTRRHRARHCEFHEDAARQEAGEAKTTPAMHVFVKGAAQSGTCGGVAMLTLVFSTLTVETLFVVNEGILDKERFSGRRYVCTLKRVAFWPFVPQAE